MLKKALLTTIILLGCQAKGFTAQESNSNVGVVNFSECMSQSKQGKQEQSSFESIKKQMSSLIEDTEKQINEVAGKFNDQDYMDGLSPEAEEEMKNRFRTLNEEMQRYQNQYYQVMNQSQMKIMQNLAASIQTASEKVAKDKKLSMVLNQETCFFTSPTLNVTTSVITEMDKNFEKASAKETNTLPTEKK